MMGECEFRNISRIRIPQHFPHSALIAKTTAETNHSPPMGARNGFDKLPKRSPRCTIPQRWVLKVDSKTYANDRKNEPFPSDGRSKWFREVTKTITKMNHSPATGAQNGFEKLPKRSQN